MAGVRHPGHRAPSRYTVKNGAQQTIKQPTITPTVFAALVSRFSDLSWAGMMAMWSLENGDERPWRVTWLPDSASVDCARRLMVVSRPNVSSMSADDCPSLLIMMRGRVKSLVGDEDVCLARRWLSSSAVTRSSELPRMTRRTGERSWTSSITLPLDGRGEHPAPPRWTLTPLEALGFHSLHNCFLLLMHLLASSSSSIFVFCVVLLYHVHVLVFVLALVLVLIPVCPLPRLSFSLSSSPYSSCCGCETAQDFHLGEPEEQCRFPTCSATAATGYDQRTWTIATLTNARWRRRPEWSHVGRRRWRATPSGRFARRTLSWWSSVPRTSRTPSRSRTQARTSASRRQVLAMYLSATDRRLWLW